MEYCCLSDGNCCKYVLRTALARTPDKAGTLALRPSQEKRHTRKYAFFLGWGEVIRTPE